MNEMSDTREAQKQRLNILDRNKQVLVVGAHADADAVMQNAKIGFGSMGRGILFFRPKFIHRCLSPISFC